MLENPYEPGGEREDARYAYEEPETVPIGGRRSFIRRMLAWLPLAFFGACLVIAMLAQPLTRAFTPVPVTGGVLPAAPTLTPSPERAGSQHLQPPQTDESAPNFGPSYKELVASRIEECTLAFHEFFFLERMAADRPDMIDSDTWREEAQAAMLIFEEGCAPLGSLPAAPSAYSEADRWLKLAAGEVDSASTRFDDLMEGDVDQIESIAAHMMKFLEYTHNAELIIDKLEDRKEI